MYEFLHYILFGYVTICMHWLHLFFLSFLQLFLVEYLSDVLDFITTGSLLYTDANIKKCELRRLTGYVSGELQNCLFFNLKIPVKQCKQDKSYLNLAVLLLALIYSFCTLEHFLLSLLQDTVFSVFKIQ